MYKRFYANQDNLGAGFQDVSGEWTEPGSPELVLVPVAPTAGTAPPVQVYHISWFVCLQVSLRRHLYWLLTQQKGKI